MQNLKHFSWAIGCSLFFTMACGYAQVPQPDFQDYKRLSHKDQAILKKLGVEKQANQDKTELQQMGSLDSYRLTVAKTEINSDGKPDYIVRSCSALYSNTGCQITLYMSKGNAWQNLGGITAFSIVFPGTKTKGYLDLYYGGPGIQKPHLWQWDGQQYK